MILGQDKNGGLPIDAKWVALIVGIFAIIGLSALLGY